ncbi:hypothetical protein [Mesorhizobium onobrychidis]|uniref:Secreted protein n=1 Tax=Mesorhizobium onobrychidis TaxID=2775404 RepID=A0ABY5R3D3_9HYPH|nr:hypothetical protein [Mesorhizobium onobrychidis]UVC17978.1 hypothetical protein IHQ72_13330 [Mesorhizobium onobrychidis]
MPVSIVYFCCCSSVGLRAATHSAAIFNAGKLFGRCVRQKAVTTCEWDGFERLIENVAAATYRQRASTARKATFD